MVFIFMLKMCIQYVNVCLTLTKRWAIVYRKLTVWLPKLHSVCCTAVRHEDVCHDTTFTYLSSVLSVSETSLKMKSAVVSLLVAVINKNECQEKMGLKSYGICSRIAESRLRRNHNIPEVLSCTPSACK